MSTPPLHFTHSTLPYWQSILPSSQTQVPSTPPYQYAYPAPLPSLPVPSSSSASSSLPTNSSNTEESKEVLLLPIRPLPSNANHAVASLLVNQASFDVVDKLAAMLAANLRARLTELGIGEEIVVVGLPSLGNTLAPIVARELGFSRYIALGYSAKFWYTETLSVSVSSITSPGAQKRIYLDPYLLPLVQGKRVVVIDDAVSSGTTVKAVWEMLVGEEVGADVVACGVVMRQGGRWREVLGGGKAGRVVGVLDSPLLERGEGGWVLRG